MSIPPHLLPAVKAHLANNITGGRDKLLFPAAGDPIKHLAPATLYRVFYKAREAASRPDLRFQIYVIQEPYSPPLQAQP